MMTTPNQFARSKTYPLLSDYGLTEETALEAAAATATKERLQATAGLVAMGVTGLICGLQALQTIGLGWLGILAALGAAVVGGYTIGVFIALPVGLVASWVWNMLHPAQRQLVAQHDSYMSRLYWPHNPRPAYYPGADKIPAPTDRDVLVRYFELLAKLNTEKAIAAPVSRLPFSRERVQAAVEAILHSPPPGTSMGALAAAYLKLGMFLDDEQLATVNPDALPRIVEQAQLVLLDRLKRWQLVSDTKSHHSRSSTHAKEASTSGTSQG